MDKNFSCGRAQKYLEKIFQFLEFGLPLIIGLAFFIPHFVFAEIFNVLGEYTVDGKSQVDAEATVSGKWSTVYLEKGLSIPTKSLEGIVQEFDERIYHNLTALLGEPWTPGIDDDSRITILIIGMPINIGWYYNRGDELPKTINPTSNEREVLYLNSDYMRSRRGYAFLSHVFQHMITYNQKERRLGREEAVWLNTLRSEYAPTYLGYDTNFQGSHLEKRVNDFQKEPFNSFNNWKNSKYDYASANMFGQYIFSRFGSSFFQKEIRTNNVGRASVEEVLRGLNPSLSFAKFFSEWRMTNYVNDRGVLNGKYSYKNSNITFKLNPELAYTLDNSHMTQTSINRIPAFGSKAISFSLNNTISANFEFSVDTPSSDLVVTYIEKLADDTLADGQFSLEKGRQGVVFNENVRSVMILLGNASENIINPTFTIKTGAAKDFRPSIPSIKRVESIFPPSNIRYNTFAIRGENFNRGSELYFNRNRKGYIYQDNLTILVEVLSNEGEKIIITVRNLDGNETNFQWQNPVVKLSDGSLVRAMGDYKVYEVLSNGKKQWIKTKEEFIKRGLRWDRIIEVNRKEFDIYSTL